MNFLNIGVLAHVDAGKTSLTERLLFNAGVIDHIGSVDTGNTQTDSLALERQRGITIKTAAVSFAVSDTTVNLLDTPGHPDFIAEVERVLNVLDGAVLVISAVEGVQAQTRILMRVLQRLKIPTVIFVNKIDRHGARYDTLLDEIAQKLTPAITPMGTVSDIGKSNADFALYEVSSQAVAGTCPVFAGSAITGVGVATLALQLTKRLPKAKGDPEGLLSGAVFKVDRGVSGEKIAYVRLFSGTIQARSVLHFGNASEGKVTAIAVFEHGKTVSKNKIVAGEIGKLWGINDIQIGDYIGAATQNSEHHFAPPTLETVIVPRSTTDKGALHVALKQLAEQDPLINLRQDADQDEIHLSLYGEVQKQVIQATLASDFGLTVSFRETTVIYIERPTSTGQAVEFLQSDSHPFSATIGLVIQPAPVDSGVQFRLQVDPPRLVPTYIYKTVGSFSEAMAEYVRQTLQKGLYGWRVTDCIVTMTNCNYYIGDGPKKKILDTPRTTAADFRKLTPLVLRRALKLAGTTVCEPMARVSLEIPNETIGIIISTLARHKAVIETIKQGRLSVIEAIVPYAEVHALQQQLPKLTGGEGVLESSFGGYRPVHGNIQKPRF